MACSLRDCGGRRALLLGFLPCSLSVGKSLLWVIFCPWQVTRIPPVFREIFNLPSLLSQVNYSAHVSSFGKSVVVVFAGPPQIRPLNSGELGSRGTESACDTRSLAHPTCTDVSSFLQDSNFQISRILFLSISTLLPSPLQFSH